MGYNATISEISEIKDIGWVRLVNRRELSKFAETV